MKDTDLINVLVQKNIITAATAEILLKEARLTQRPVEDFIYEKRLADEEEVAKVKSELLGVPYKPLKAADVSAEVLKIIPAEVSHTFRVIPLAVDKDKNMLIVGMLQPDDVQAQEALRFIAKQNRLSLGIYLITPSVLSAIWRRYAPYKSEIEIAVKEAGEGPVEREMVELEEGGTSQEAPIIKIVASTLREAVIVGASDIHIEPQRNRLRIRFRIDGELQEVVSLPLRLTQQIVSRIKVLARLKLDENRMPQDGRFRTTVFGQEIDYRVSTFPTPSGEKVAIRVLDSSRGLKGFENLGLNDYNYQILNEGINRPYGMILISGPTGSGKTTTLYAVMQRLNSEKVNIVSLEDPVEYFIEGLNQSQVKPEIGYDFASGLRQILRQDPDVIMVGEIRDKETASLAVNAALTGHIILSTIHTNNAIGVIPRLVDLGVPPFLLSSALNLMIAQRLIPQLCPECRQMSKTSEKITKIIAQNLENLPPAVKNSLNVEPPFTLYQAGSKSTCQRCKGKGIFGRVAIFEIFRMTRDVGELINTGFTEGKLSDEAKKQGMITMRQDGIIKALNGQVAIEAVLKETEETI